jgi:cell wall-associated NlpC family hydrolase
VGSDMKHFLALFIMISVGLLWAPALTAHASTSAIPASRALGWAEANAAGHFYAWGGTGPSYDCSGLVMEAVGRAYGIWLPHNTTMMVRSWHLVRTWHPSRGSLAFWGAVGNPYHVEFVTSWWETTFGAHDSGSRIGWMNWHYWIAPSAYYDIR